MNYPSDEEARKKPIGRLTLGILLCVLPLVISFFSPLRPDTALVYVGLLPAFVALPSGPRVTFGTAFATGTAMFLGLLLSDTPILAALLMMGLAVGVAFSHTQGWQAAGTYVATQAGLAAVAAPSARVLEHGVHAPSSLTNAATVAAVALGAGLWVAVFGSLTLHGIVSTPHRKEWDEDMTIFAATLAILLGISTFALMNFTNGGNAWWILLTILVSVAPTAKASITRAFQRAGGTVVGGAIAALLIVTIDDRGLLITVGFIAAIVSAVSYIKAPYWIFSASLTLALVLLALPQARALHGDFQRVAFTIIAALIVVAVSLGTDYARKRFSQQS